MRRLLWWLHTEATPGDLLHAAVATVSMLAFAVLLCDAIVRNS